MQFVYMLKSCQCFWILCIKFYRETIKNFLIFVHYSDIDSVKHNLYTKGVPSKTGTKVHNIFSLLRRLPLPSVADTDPTNGLQIPNDSNESYNPKSQHWEEGQAGRTLTGLK